MVNLESLLFFKNIDELMKLVDKNVLKKKEVLEKFFNNDIISIILKFLYGKKTQLVNLYNILDKNKYRFIKRPSIYDKNLYKIRYFINEINLLI